MSGVAILGALELGLVYALVALASYLSFRVLDFPDLTVDGSFATGAALTGACISQGVNPWVTSFGALLSGGLCGLITALLNRRFGMLHLLAGILTTIGLFSIDLRIMGRPNIPLMDSPTVFSPLLGLGFGDSEVRVAVVFVIVLITLAVLTWFLRTEAGLAMRVTGANPRMARANGVNVDRMTYLGLALSNALAALGGSLFTQSAGFADVGVGGGSILFGLAAVILGEALLPSSRIGLALIACVLGSILYRLAVGLALNAQFLGLRSSDLRLVTAVLIAAAFIATNLRRNSRAGPKRQSVAPFAGGASS